MSRPIQGLALLLTLSLTAAPAPPRNGSEALAAGETFFDAGRIREAKGAFETALKFAQEAQDSGGEGKARIGLGKALDALGDYAPAKVQLEQALELCRKAGDRKGEGDALENLGGVYGDFGEMNEALAFFEKALAIHGEIRNPSGQAKALNDIGLASSMLGDKAKALECYEKAVLLYTQAGRPRDAALALNNIGAMYQDLGQMDKAQAYLERALALSTELGYHLGIARASNNLGVIFEQNGQLAKALEYQERALPLWREAGDRAGEATTLNNIGKIHFSLGQKTRALEFYEKDLEICREIGDRYGETTSLNNIARIHEGLGNPAKCLEYDEKALALRHELGDRSGEAMSLTNLGQAHAGLGQLAKGAEEMEQALRLFREVGNRRGEAIALGGRGRIFMEQGQREQARQYLEQALPIHREVGNREMEARTLGSLAERAEAAGQLALAAFWGKQCVNAHQALRSDLKPLGLDDRKAYLQTIERAYRSLAGVLLRQQRPGEAHQVLSLLKEQEYFEYSQGAQTQAQAMAGVELNGIEARLEGPFQETLGTVAKLGGEWNVLQIKKRSPQEEAQLAQARASLEASLRAWEALGSTLAEALEATQGQARPSFVPAQAKALWRDLRSMGAGTAVVYTLLEKDRLWLLGLTSGEVKAWEVKRASGDLEGTLQAFQASLQNPRFDPRPSGKRLYDDLVAPLHAWRKEKKIQRILWSLDGPLRYVSLGALWNGKRYFVEELPGAIFTPAARLNLARGAASRRTLGGGVSQALGGFPALPDVPEELRAIVKGPGHSGGILTGELLLDSSFTEARVRASLKQGFPVLHVASHFNLSPLGEKDSFMLMGDGSKWSLESMRAGGDLFRGLDLLVLSACRSGIGAQGPLGREVEGFGVMAQRQGARSVLASLWPVADVSTGALMRRFYRAWSQGQSKQSALRSAQLDLLKGRVASLEGRVDRGGAGATVAQTSAAPLFPWASDRPFAHPFYWAPFVLMGSGE